VELKRGSIYYLYSTMSLYMLEYYLCTDPRKVAHPHAPLFTKQQYKMAPANDDNGQKLGR